MLGGVKASRHGVAVLFSQIRYLSVRVSAAERWPKRCMKG